MFLLEESQVVHQNDQLRNELIDQNRVQNAQILKILKRLNTLDRYLAVVIYLPQYPLITLLLTSECHQKSRQGK